MYLEESLVNEVREEAVKLLKSHGVKHTIKKSDYKYHSEKKIEVYHVFKTSLELLEKESVAIHENGVQAQLPVFVIDTCKFIEQNLDIEGLFRKAGSTCKQRELRALLDCGNRLEPDPDHHPINVANILKLFFRELPEPLIPFKFHSLLLRCLSLKHKQVESILVACLLLPTIHLNTLSYLMQFLNRVSANAFVNKMDVGNLAIIFAPSIMPVNSPKLTAHGSEKINHHVQIIRILIENSSLIGVVPEVICERLGLLNNSFSSCGEMDGSQVSRKRKKKRSSSLTRMFSGIKKIITAKPSPEISNIRLSPNNQCYTPRIINSIKRKNTSHAFSAKKKRDVLRILPDGMALGNTPHKIKFSSTTLLTPRTLIALPDNDNFTNNKVARHSSIQERRVARKEHSSVMLPSNSLELPETSHRFSCDNCGTTRSDKNPSSPPQNTNAKDYIRIPRNEYEAIKERVIQIENRLESELENILGNSSTDSDDVNRSKLSVMSEPYFENVQSAYVKAVEESGKLNDSTTDKLTQKLSRDLRIRRSDRIIRSPSARKIGSIRRRSKDNNQYKSVNRHLSLNTCDRPKSGSLYASKRSSLLRRGRPNTILTGLPQPGSVNSQERYIPDPMDTCPSTEISSDEVNLSKVEDGAISDTDGHTNEWLSAEAFFDKHNPECSLDEVRRDSIAQIRSKNAGMVLAKAKLFEGARISSSESIKNESYFSKPTLIPDNLFRTEETLNVKNYVNVPFRTESSDYGSHSENTPPIARRLRRRTVSPLKNIHQNCKNKHVCTLFHSPNKVTKRTPDHKQKQRPRIINNVAVRRSPRFNVYTSISVQAE